jgi:UDP-N-acetylglucosamine transferase subunit ALG13
MILVAVGTHHQPFDRLLRAADAAARALDERLVAQVGPSRVPLQAEVHVVLPPARFEALLVEARVVVLHGGSSSFLQARALGRRPIVVPRRPEHGEHVDDHQVRFARTLPPAEAATTEPELLLEAIRSHVEPPGTGVGGHSDRFCQRFDALVTELMSRR